MLLKKNYPPSIFLSEESQKSYLQDTLNKKETFKHLGELFPALGKAKPNEILALRQSFAEYFYTTPRYTDMLGRYDVSIQSRNIGGTATEVFTPVEGVAHANQKKVLINLHGGALVCGERTYARLESIPIAAMAKIKVVSVDYRMGPEHRFPAASDDIAAVYQALLQRYKPENIGIYGSSAGGLLTAQSIARLQKENLPLPGAVGMFGGAGYFWDQGDLGYFFQAMQGLAEPPVGPETNPYLRGVDNQDPMVFPGNSPEILAKFPPSLLISSTRDFALSSVVHTHSELIKQGVDADLHVWEGLDHCFYCCCEQPESRQAYKVIVDFFNKHI